jgi:hypothetical protein
MYNEDKQRAVVQNAHWVAEEVLIKQVQGEFDAWRAAIETKRRIKEKELQTLYVPAVKRGKVNVNSIYTTMQTLMSVYYGDRMNVQFEGRSKAVAQLANNLNKMATFDYEEMDLDKIDYKWNWDRFFFWVGIKVLDGWDANTSTPIFKNVSPLSWIPDPQGWFTIESHRWAGFEIENTKEALKYNKAFFNVELINKEGADRQEEIRQAYTLWRSLTDDWIEDTPNQKYSLYNHYTLIDWKKYLITLANHRSLVVRMIEIEPVLKEEKSNASKILFPIALKYYSPVEGDPFGVSIPDLMKDKQSSESKLFNLAILKETRNALGEDLFYDGKMIKNAKELTRPSIQPKAIAVNVQDNKVLSQSVYRPQKEQNAWSAFNTTGQLQFQNAMSTGLDANSLWVSNNAGQTATEAQITQQNANLRFILGTKIGKWGETIAWKLWFRSYVSNLKSDNKKVVRLTETFWPQFFEFGREDFPTTEDIDITIISVSEQESRNEKRKADVYALLPQFLADPEVTSIGKLIMKREALLLAGYSLDDVMAITYNADEQAALLDVELLNEGEEAVEPKDGQDHLLFMSIYRSADDTPEKFDAIQARHTKYLEVKLQAVEEQGDGWALGNIASAAGAKRMNNLVQEEANNVPSNLG